MECSCGFVDFCYDVLVCFIFIRNNVVKIGEFVDVLDLVFFDVKVGVIFLVYF